MNNNEIIDEEQDSFSDSEENLNNSIDYNDDDEKSLLIDGKNQGEKENINIVEEVKKKKTIFQHPYFKDVILVYFLFSLLVMSIVCYGLFIPNVIIDYVQKQYPNYNEAQVQSKASYIKSFTDSAPYICNFIFGPFLGVLSDKYGRKVPLFFTAFIQILDMVSCYITIRTNSLIPFAIGHFFGGLANSSIPAVYSYLADLTEVDLVPTTFALTGMALGLGVIIGPAIFFIGTNFPKNTFLNLYISIGFIVLAVIVIILLRESLKIAKENNRIKQTKRTANPFKLIKRLFTASPYVSLVILVYAATMFCIEDVLSTYVYSTSLRYGWTSKVQSLYMIGSGTFMVIWSILIIPQLLKYYSERKIISLGLIIGFSSRIAYSFAINQYIWMVASAFGAFLPQCISLIHSVISRATPPEIQGSILTGVQSIGSLSGFVGTLVFGNLYSFAISSKSPKFFPGAPYLLDGCILLVIFVGSLLIWRKYSNPNPLKRRLKKSISKSFIIN